MVAAAEAAAREVVVAAVELVVAEDPAVLAAVELVVAVDPVVLAAVELVAAEDPVVLAEAVSAVAGAAVPEVAVVVTPEAKKSPLELLCWAKVRPKIS